MVTVETPVYEEDVLYLRNLLSDEPSLVIRGVGNLLCASRMSYGKIDDDLCYAETWSELVCELKRLKGRLS